MTEDLSTGILRQDVEIRWPDRLPITVEEIVAFQKDNWFNLLHLASLEIVGLLGKLTLDYQRERWEFGRKKYEGNPLFSGNEPREAYCEIADFINWHTKQLLLEHFSQ